MGIIIAEQTLGQFIQSQIAGELITYTGFGKYRDFQLTFHRGVEVNSKIRQLITSYFEARSICVTFDSHMTASFIDEGVEILMVVTNSSSVPLLNVGFHEIR